MGGPKSGPTHINRIKFNKGQRFPANLGVELMRKIRQKNKRGWIRLVEAFIAILLVAGVLFFIMAQKYIEERNISEQIYQEEVSILREIEMDKTLREQVLDVDVATLPVSWEITQEIPSHLDCLAKICGIADACALEEELEEEITGNIYVQSVGIFADLRDYNPRQLKIFCWVKET